MKCGVRQKITMYVTHNVQIKFSIPTLYKLQLTKFQIFTKLPQVSNIRKNSNFLRIVELLRPTAPSYKFYGRDM